MKLSNLAVSGLFLLFTCTILLSSCKKEEGCTDPASENYDPEAKDDDGTCIPITEKFLGTYTVLEECSTDTYTYTMSITDSSSDGFTIVMANFGDFQQAVTATVDGKFLSIPDQTIINNSGNISIMSGLGEINGNSLTLTYSYSIDGGVVEVCSKDCTKI